MVIRIQIDIWIVSVVSILWILIPVTHLDCGTHVLWFVSVLTVWILSPSRKNKGGKEAGPLHLPVINVIIKVITKIHHSFVKVVIAQSIIKLY